MNPYSGSPEVTNRPRNGQVITGQEEPLHRKYTHRKPLPLTTNTPIKSPSATLSGEIRSELANPSLINICDRNCLSTDFLVHSNYDFVWLFKTWFFSDMLIVVYICTLKEYFIKPFTKTKNTKTKNISFISHFIFFPYF